MSVYFHYCLLTLLVLVFVHAIYHKVTDFYRFTGVLTNYRILPYELSNGASYSIIGLEVGATLLSLFPVSRSAGLMLFAALLGMYLLAMGWNLLKGRNSISCGCGGEPTPISYRQILRNSTLIVLACVAMQTPSTGADVAGVLVAMLTGFVFWLMYLLTEKVWALVAINKPVTASDLLQVKK